MDEYNVNYDEGFDEGYAEGIDKGRLFVIYELMNSLSNEHKSEALAHLTRLQLESETPRQHADRLADMLRKREDGVTLGMVAKAYMKANEKIWAIKVVREFTGFGLKAAKVAVENL